MTNIKKNTIELINVTSFAIICFCLSRAIMFIQFGYSHNDWSFISFLYDGLHHWDAQWYELYSKSILDGSFSTQVHDNGEAVWAFFPFFPMIEALLSKTLGIAFFPAIAFISNALFMIIGEVFAYKYIKLSRHNKDEGYLYIFIISFGLFSFYLSSMYSESLFLMLLIICFYLLKRKQYIMLGIFGAMLSATRNVGIFFVFVILANQISEYFALISVSDDKPKNLLVYITGFLRYIFKKPLVILSTTLIPAGFFAYSLYLHFTLHDGLAFLRVQKAWGRNAGGLISSFIQETFENFPPTLLSVEFIGFVILLAIIFINKRYDEFIFPFIVLIVSSSSSLLSVGRLGFGSFTLLLSLCDTLINFKKPLRYLILLIILILESSFVFAWFKSDFFVM